MIYLNNAATTQQKPEGVKGAAPVTPDEARTMTAKFFGLKTEHPEQNVFFTQGGTQAMALALRALIHSGDHVIATVMEQDSTWAVLDDLAAAGVQVSCVGIDAYGVLRYEDIEPMIQENTRAIVCAHGCAVTGNIADLEQVGGLARRHKLLLISDGSQTVGATDINLKNLGVDVYCFTAHKKLMGPYGVGGIILKKGLRDQFLGGLESLTPAAGATPASSLTDHEKAAALMRQADNDKAAIYVPLAGDDVLSTPAAVADAAVLAAMPHRAASILAAAEPSMEKLGGLCAALSFIREKGIYGVSIFPHRLAKRFFESVSSMDDVKVYGDFGTGSRIPTVSIAVKGFTPAQVKEHMVKKYGIVVKDGFHDSVRMHQALGTAETGLTRFSFGYFNTRRDVNDAIWALMDLLQLDDLYLLA